MILGLLPVLWRICELGVARDHAIRLRLGLLALGGHTSLLAMAHELSAELCSRSFSFFTEVRRFPCELSSSHLPDRHGCSIIDRLTHGGLRGFGCRDGLIYWLRARVVRFAAICLQDPIVLAIVVIVVPFHDCLEKMTQSCIVWLLFKSHVSAYADVASKLLWHLHAELLNCSLQFFLFDLIVLFVLVSATLEALPRQHTFQEVEQNIANCLQVVSARLFDANMRIH